MARSAQSQRHLSGTQPLTTEKDRRRFTVLVVLGFVVVVLFWIWTMPFSKKVHAGEATAAGPRAFFGVIGDQIAEGARIKEIFSGFSSGTEQSN